MLDPHNPHTNPRIVLAVAFIGLVIMMGVIAATSHGADNRVEVYHCNHAWYQRYEDGSGILFCNEDPMVRVHVSR